MRRHPGRPGDRARTARPARRQALRAFARSGLVIGVASSLYALAPLGRRVDGTVALQLALWLLLLSAVCAWQIRAVIRSPFPALRAAEAVAVSVPLLVLMFATAFFVTSRGDPAAFSEPLGRIDALYFSVTVFATVGFGDIVPRSDAARLLVTTQMLADLVLVGFIAKVLFGAVQHRQRTLAPPPA